MILISFMIILTSVFGVVQSVFLILSPNIIETQRRQVVSHSKMQANAFRSNRRTKTSRRPSKGEVTQLFKHLKQFAKFDFAIGLFKLPLSLVLIVSTLFCLYRARWARGLTRWSCLLAAGLTILQYGAFGYGMWFAMGLNNNVSLALKESAIPSILVAVVIGTSMFAIYFSGWKVLNFPATRAIFGE